MQSATGRLTCGIHTLTFTTAYVCAFTYLHSYLMKPAQLIVLN